MRRLGLAAVLLLSACGGEETPEPVDAVPVQEPAVWPVMACETPGEQVVTDVVTRRRWKPRQMRYSDQRMLDEGYVRAFTSICSAGRWSEPDYLWLERDRAFALLAEHEARMMTSEPDDVLP